MTVRLPILAAAASFFLASACDYSKIVIPEKYRGNGGVIVPSGKVLAVDIHTSYIIDNGYLRCATAAEATTGGILVTLQAAPIVNFTQTVDTCCVFLAEPSSGSMVAGWMGFSPDDSTVITCNGQATCSGMSNTFYNMSTSIDAFESAVSIDPPVNVPIGVILGIIGGLTVLGIVCYFAAVAFCKNRGKSYDPTADIDAALAQAKSRDAHMAHKSAEMGASSASAEDKHGGNKVFPDPERG